jgi:hypothetical protein
MLHGRLMSQMDKIYLLRKISMVNNIVLAGDYAYIVVVSFWNSAV